MILYIGIWNRIILWGRAVGGRLGILGLLSGRSFSLRIGLMLVPLCICRIKHLLGIITPLRLICLPLALLSLKSLLAECLGIVRPKSSWFRNLNKMILPFLIQSKTTILKISSLNAVKTNRWKDSLKNNF